MNDNPQDTIMFMLGEMRADLKQLVHSRSNTNARIDAIEAAQAELNQETDKRLKSLEHFKTRIGVLTAGLSVTVPTIITAIAATLGWI